MSDRDRLAPVGAYFKMTSGYSSNLRHIFASLWKNRDLVLQMTVREVVGRYRGSMMGLLWSFFNPVLMLVVYTFVFSVVFQARWDVNTVGKTDFALLVFTGMLVHALFAECINRSSRLVLDNSNYVKKVIFPLEILPWVCMGSAFFHMLISVLVLLVAFLIIHHYLNWTIILFPLVIAPFVLFTMGLTWWLAATGVYLRDLGQITGVLTTVLLFVSPVFYPVAALPKQYQLFFNLNPLTFVIKQVRDILIWGKPPDWEGLALYSAIGIATAWAGLFWFQRTRHGFADVI